jgi:hypothetical protein
MYWIPTANVCGRVAKDDGSPLAGADVTMTQIRDEEQLPPKTASDPNLSKKDGSFCVEQVQPGRYIMTAETTDYEKNTRLSAYYPGVSRRSEAKVIEVMPRQNQSGRNLQVREEPLFDVRFQVVTDDGSPPPSRVLGIFIRSVKPDPLSYEESHGVEGDGSYTLGLIPKGHYVVGTYFDPDYDEKTGDGKEPPEARMWNTAKKEVDISSSREVLIKIGRKK